MLTPTLALNFTTGVLDPRVTVTRALDTATRVNSSGLIEVVTATGMSIKLPTASTGLSSGMIWNNAGTITIV